MIDFDTAINRLLSHEGGFTQDSRDPGKLKGSKYGISSASFPDVDIRNLTRDQAKDIYRRKYWDAVKDVSDAVRYQMLDAGVNHGTHRAIKLLQKAVGATADGAWGPISASHAAATDNNDILLRFLAHRLIFMTDTRIWITCGRGWARRSSTKHRTGGDRNMKRLIMALTLATLSGCASLNYAGNADYSVKPFVAQDGSMQCCEVRVHNGKEIGLLEATINVKADGSYKVHLMEKSILAIDATTGLRQRLTNANWNLVARAWS